MNKKFLCIILLSTLPFQGFAALCRSITPSCVRDTLNGTGKYICTALASAPTITIDLLNYPTVITNAINNLPLTGTTAIPACIAEAASATFGAIPQTWTNYSIRTTFNAQALASSSLFPNATPSVIKISSTQNSAYLGGTITYCPCGSSSGTTCSLTPINIGFNNTVNLLYNNNKISGYNLGYCRENGSSSGAILMKVYSPSGQIPPIGTYSADIGITAQSIGP